MAESSGGGASSCPACGSESPPDARFCMHCAAPLPTRCGACGAAVPSDARFCPQCAHPTQTPASAPAAPVRPGAQPAVRDPRAYTPKHLADKILQSKSALEGERKQVTVLFADVKGSMELAEQLDPEEWHRVLERFFEILTEGVHRFEGTINQYTGDGIMALFGAPISHEDHAHRACYAALHLAETLRRYADALRIEHGLNFSVRMGINSGDVVVGKIGDDLRMDYTAQGHTVGLAQRMESLADSGKAMLAGPTIDLAQGYFALRDLGAMQVKGIDSPVRVAELEGVGRMRTRLDRSRARGLSKFVGRDEELGRLETALRRTLDGDGQAIGVMAEAGSGKSRLCFEFLESCRARGITVRTATGVPHGHAVPLQPILEFYREIFGASPDDGDAQLRQKIAGSVAQMAAEELESLPLLYDFMRVPDPAQPAPDLSSEERQSAVMALLRRLTAARSRREPAVLVFEDMHWVDPDTEAIVDGIVDAAVGTRTLVLLNFRPEYRAPWIGRTHYQQIALRPLDVAAARLLLEDWLGSDPSLASFSELVCKSTGGNPFFMEEVVQAAIESGALVGARRRFRLERSVESIEVPVSVQSLLAARIDRLDDATKRLLQTAAVIGDEVPEKLLERVAEFAGDALPGGIRRLVQGEFLYEASLYPESEYAFKHPLTREVAYASLLRERRQALHGAVARGIEALAGDAVEQRATLLAHHWEQAGRKLEAAQWQTRVAQRLGLNAGEAVFHWRKVIDLLGEERETAEARELLSQARSRLVYVAGRSAASEAEVARLFAEARREYGDIDSPGHALAVISYAIVRAGAGATAEARELGDEALAMARRLPGKDALVAVLGGIVLSRLASEFPTECEHFGEEIDRLCAEDTSLGEELAGYRAWQVVPAMRMLGLRRLGRGSDVDASIAETRRRMKVESRYFSGTIQHFTLAQELARRGDASEALEHGRLALEAAVQSQNLALIVLGHTARGAGFACAGRLEEAREQIEQALVLAIDRAAMKPVAASISLPLLAEIELRSGDVDASIAAARRGVELARSIEYSHAEADNEIALAQALVASGDAAGADAAIARAAQLADSLDARDLLAQLEEVRAELSRLRGDAADWERLLREAVRLHLENGEPWLATRAEARIRT